MIFDTQLSKEEYDALILSFKVAIWACCVSLPFGIIFGLILARTDFYGKAILNGIIHLPLVLPPVVVGYLLLISFGREGFIGSLLFNYFNISFSFKWTGAALACAIMGFPLLVRSIRLSVEMIDPKIEQAAMSLGARPIYVFFLITFPLMLPGILVGFTLSFARALGEFGATITFVSNIPGETQTLSSAIYSFLQIPNGEANALRLTMISIFVSMSALILSEVIFKLIRKKLLDSNA